MTTRDTLPVESEPYTLGYYAIWGLLSLGAIFYIAFLAFWPGQSSIIKISKVADRTRLEAELGEQGKRLSTAMTIAAQARGKSEANSTRIESLEKRVQLLTWKVADNRPVAEVSNEVSNNELPVANDYLKQMIAGGQAGSDLVGVVRAAPSEAVELAKNTASEMDPNAAADPVSTLAGAVITAPVGDKEIIAKTAEKLNTPHPLKLAAVAAGVAKAVDPVAQYIPTKLDAMTEKAAPIAAKVAEAVADNPLTKTAAQIATAAPLPLKAAKPMAANPKKKPAAQAPKAAPVHQKVAANAATLAPKIIAARKPPIANVPLPVRKSYGVRLTSGRSVESLRLTWDLLNEMNRPIFKGLKTRFVEAPSPIGMPYRLIAGPMRSAPQAKALCAKLHKQNINCDVTVFKGRRL